MSGTDETRAAPHARRRLIVLGGALAALLVTLTLLSMRGPGEDAARQLTEDYLEARSTDGCGHYAYYSEDFARQENVDVKDCQADEALAAGEYDAYSVEEVRARRVRAEVEVADDSDASYGPFTVILVVEDGEWRIGDIEKSES